MVQEEDSQNAPIPKQSITSSFGIGHQPIPGYVVEKLYQKMVDEVVDYAILLLDIEGNILTWNKGAASVKGYTEAEAVGQNFRMFYTDEDREDKLPDRLLELAKTQGRASHEGWRLKKDGSKFWGSVLITALHDDQQAVIGFSKLTRDLTERKQAEERQKRYTLELQHHNEMLRRSEERYQRMTAEVEDYAIILLDTQGNILNWNKGAQKIKGYSEDEILGRNFRLFYMQEDQQSGLPEELLDTAVRQNKATHEGWRVRKDGTLFWGSIVITALHDSDGAVIGFSKVTRDLTQKREYEEYILRQNQLLADYAHVASHDLQEPLRKLQLFSGMLRSHLDDPEASRRYLEKIDNSASKMSSLIKDILRYAQTESDSELMENVNLSTVLENVRDDMELALEASHATLEWRDLPTVRAVPVQMQQLFSNLVHNAVKFSDKPPVIRITTETVEESSGFKSRITVSDNGIGFDPQYADHIFGMFQRLKQAKPGTGIGLALCRRIVEGHGGTISASSTPGTGSVFFITLPLPSC